MSSSESMLIFIIAAFCLAGVLIVRKETIPPPLRKGLAIISLILVVFAFFLIIYAFLQLKPAA